MKHVKLQQAQIPVSSIHIVFEGGASIETPGTRGASHLIEHIIAARLDHVQEDYDLLEIHTNAYTTQTSVIFYMTCMSKYFTQHIDHYVNSLLSDTDFSREIFDREKAIVIQEIQNYYTDPIFNHIANSYRYLYGTYLPAGCITDIENLTYEQCLEFYNKNYKLSKTTVITHTDLEALPKDILVKLELNGTIHSYDCFADANQFRFKTGIVRDFLNMEFPDDNISVIYALKQPIGIQHHDHLRVIAKILAGKSSSVFFRILRQELGIVYDVSMEVERLNGVSLTVCIGAQVSSENFVKYTEKMNDILSNPENFIPVSKFLDFKESLSVTQERKKLFSHINIEHLIYPDEGNYHLVTYESLIHTFRELLAPENWLILTNKSLELQCRAN